MVDQKRVGGLIYLKVNGRQYRALGDFTYNLGEPKRESVVGADGYHGYKETPQVAFIEGEITDTFGVDLRAVVRERDATVTLEKANTKTVVLRHGVFCHEGTGSTADGKFPVRWEGESAEET
jgi:hypothetical protein